MSKAFNSLTRGLIFVLIAISLITDTTSSCAKGCLKCNTSTSKCQICDYYLGFNLKSDGGCKKLDIENCAVVVPSVGKTECLQCEDEMIFDTTSNKCVAVPGDRIIQKCKLYNNSAACVQCTDKSYMSDGNCLSVSIEVDGCLEFSSATVCSVCSGNTRFNPSSTNCESFEVQSNCQSHSFTKCDSCATDYVLDPNQHFTLAILDSSGNPNQSIISYLFDDVLHQGKYRKNREDPFTLCQTTKYTNCATYAKINDTIMGCATCLDNHLLNDLSKSCDSYPTNAPIEDCVLYLDATTCAKCNDNYYTLNGSECVASNTVDECLYYKTTEDKCAECNSTHWLQANQCQQRTSGYTCSKFNKTADACECETNFVQTTDSKKCLPQILKCTTYAPSTHTDEVLTCNICANGSYPNSEKTSCLDQSSNDCSGYVENTNNCNACDSEFYLHDSNSDGVITCSQKSLSHCTKYEAGDDNTCLECENLYYKQNDKTCLDITASNCAKSTLNTNACEACAKFSYLVSIVECSADSSKVDALCTEVVDEGECKACSHGYIPFMLTGLYADIELPQNCAKANSEGTCIQCNEDMNGSGTSTCLANNNSTTLCKQLKESSFVDLEATSCAVCRDNAKYYLENSNDTCTSRSFYTRVNCLTLNVSEDKCNVCKSDHSVGKLSSVSNTCIPVPYADTEIGITALDYCRVYNYFDNTKCMECIVGYELSDYACANSSPPDSTNHYKFDVDIQNIKTNVVTEITDCTKYDSLNSAICIECAANYILKIDGYNENSFILTSNLLYVTSSIVRTCVPESELSNNYARLNDSTSRTVANCGIAYLYEATYFCMVCKTNFIGTVFEATHKANDGALTSGKMAFKACDESSEISKTYKNSLYTDLSNINTSKTFKGEIFDTCATEGNFVVYFFKNDSYEMGREGLINSNNKIAKCIVLNAPIPFCQVHWVPSSDSRETLPTFDQSDLYCLACKPGYHLNNNQCTRIIQCDLTQTNNNTWLSSCQTCNEGFTWSYNDSSTINIYECVQNRVNDCLVKGISSTKCIICQLEKTLNKSTHECESYPEVCATTGMPSHNLTTNSDTAIDNLNRMFLTFIFADKLNEGANICATCLAGTYFFRSESTDEDKNLCFPKSLNINFDDNCEFYSDINECFKCKTDFVLLTDSKICVSLSTQYCLERQSGDDKCTKCMESYLPNPSGSCIPNHYCSEHNTEKCMMCNENYKPTNPPSFLCEIINDSDPCKQYDGQNACVACKNNDEIPIRKLNSAGVELNTYCIEKSNQYSNTDFLYVYEKQSEYYNQIDYPDSYKIGKRTIEFASDSTFPKYICLKGPTDVSCSQFSATNHYECLICQDGYYLDSRKRCTLGEINGCKTYTTKLQCSACNNISINNSTTYYLSVGICEAHTISYCDKYLSTDNKCEECQNGYKLATGICLDNTVAVNCTNSRLNEDVCLECNTGHYLDGDICTGYSVGNCDGYHATLNKCLKCLSGFYMNNANNCLENNAINCLIKSDTQNTCETCTDDTFYVEEGHGCKKQITITNCQEYSFTSPTCINCSPGFYLSINNCIDNPNGIKDCIVYSDATTCTQCKLDHYLAENVCTAASPVILNCLIYATNTTCGTCNAGKLKTANETACETPNDTSCETWTDTDNCASCSGNKVLNTTDGTTTCSASGIGNCTTAIVNESVISCTLCNPEFILKNGACNRAEVTIDGCAIYNEVDESCESCYTGHVLSFDKNTCATNIIIAGANCSKAHIVSDTLPSCILCDFGYRMNLEGVCEICGGEGCTLCNSLDNAKCDLCSQGYFMNASSACALNDPIIKTESVRVVTMTVMFALVSLFLKNE